MERSQVVATETMEESKHIETVFFKISDKVNIIVKMNSMIKQASQEQAVTAIEIDKRVHRIQEKGGDASSISKDTASTSDQMLTQAIELKKALNRFSV
mgnify:FL=1